VSLVSRSLCEIIIVVDNLVIVFRECAMTTGFLAIADRPTAIYPNFRTRGLGGIGVPYLLEYGDENDQKAEHVYG